MAATVATGAISTYRAFSAPSYTLSGSGGGQAVAQVRAGREPVHPSRIRLPRCGHSHRCGGVSRNERLSLTAGTSFSVMRGTTGEGVSAEAYSGRSFLNAVAASLMS